MPKAGRARNRSQSLNTGSQDAREQESVTQERTATDGRRVKPIYRAREMSPRTRVISLVIGDILCFLIFSSLGQTSHHENLNVLSVVLVALPFMAGWFLVAPFLGAFRSDVAARPTKMIIRTLLCWLVAWPVAMILRAIFVDHAPPPVSFALVVLCVNLALLLLWRWPFALNNEYSHRQGWDHAYLAQRLRRAMRFGFG
jgi:uncharacterized membrane protein YphA (DoxX/SURF4 family)